MYLCARVCVCVCVRDFDNCIFSALPTLCCVLLCLLTSWSHGIHKTPVILMWLLPLKKSTADSLNNCHRMAGLRTLPRALQLVEEVSGASASCFTSLTRELLMVSHFLTPLCFSSRDLAFVASSSAGLGYWRNQSVSLSVWKPGRFTHGFQCICLWTL